MNTILCHINLFRFSFVLESPTGKAGLWGGGLQGPPGGVRLEVHLQVGTSGPVESNAGLHSGGSKSSRLKSSVGAQLGK